MFMFGACEKVAEEQPTTGQEVAEAPVDVPVEAPEEEPTEETTLLPFTQNLCFWFSSGAGAWRTELLLSPDGTFSGEFSDSDMGVTGPGYEEYGTLYYSVFTRYLTAPTIFSMLGKNA